LSWILVSNKEAIVVNRLSIESGIRYPKKPF